MADTSKRCVYIKKTDTIKLPAGIITFAAIAKKWKNREKPDDDGAYILNMIYPKDCDFSVLADEVNKVGAARFKDQWKKPGMKKPFLRAEEKLDPDRLPEGFDPTGWTLIRANTYQSRPNVLYPDASVVDEEDLMDQVYNGREACMTVKPSAYDNAGNRGVKLYLSNVQLLRKLKQWPGGGARAAAEDEFEAVDIPDDEGGGKASTDAMFD